MIHQHAQNLLAHISGRKELEPDVERSFAQLDTKKEVLGQDGKKETAHTTADVIRQSVEDSRTRNANMRSYGRSESSLVTPFDNAESSSSSDTESQNEPYHGEKKDTYESDSKGFPRISKPVELLRNSYDCVVIGSEYGGGVAASRMTRAGQEVSLLERGLEWWPGEHTKPKAGYQTSGSDQASASGTPQLGLRASDSRTPITGRIRRAKTGVPVHTCELCRPAKTFTRAEHLR